MSYYPCVCERIVAYMNEKHGDADVLLQKSLGMEALFVTRDTPPEIAETIARSSVEKIDWEAYRPHLGSVEFEPVIPI